MAVNIQFKIWYHALFISFLLIIIIGVFDYITGPEIAFSIFYLIPVLIIAFQKNIKIHYIILNAIVASVAWFLAEFYTTGYSNNLIPVWNAFIRLIIFVLVGQLAFYSNQKHQKLIETNKKLEALNEEKNKFIGIAAHDLRNPVGTIFAFSELLLTRYREKADPKTLEIIQYIKDLSDHTLKLLGQLLDISQIESGTIVLSYKHQDYVEFVKKYVALNQMLADKKHIKINFQPPKKALNYAFDEHYLSEVINNLLSNAIKYSYPNSEITLLISKTKDYIRTDIRDTGKGIPQDEHEKLFKYFQKTSVKPTSGEKSTGLGLAIAKKIVTEHNGTIGVESEPDKGSNFYYELPIRKKNIKNRSILN